MSFSHPANTKQSSNYPTKNRGQKNFHFTANIQEVIKAMSTWDILCILIMPDDWFLSWNKFVAFNKFYLNKPVNSVYIYIYYI